MNDAAPSAVVLHCIDVFDHRMTAACLAFCDAALILATAPEEGMERSLT
jgi:hypothetical protein